MKLKTAITIVFTGTLFLILGFQLQEQRIKTDGFDELKRTFKTPGNEYGTTPFWVWNTKVSRELIDSMMLDYKKNDFGGVIVHPRPGLITEYLSNEWFSLFQYAKETGKKLGLKVWIYDENSYPTGFGGGLVPDQMPESYNQGQMLYMTEVSTIPENQGDIFIVLKMKGEQYIDISSTLATEKGKTGKYRIFKKVNYEKSNRGTVAGPIGSSYVDLMAKGVTQKFMDITFKGYEKVAGPEFGETVPGIFSDEPTIINEGKDCVRWTPDLFARFKEKWGYDLRLNLPSLFEETGNWKKVRHNYYQTLLQLFIDRWSKPMYNYTEQHNLIWTGHYWEHGWPSPYHGPDNMAMYAWHQMPGIDMLFNQFNEDKPVQFGNIRAVKELGSVANQLGKKRTLSETYGGGGWELTFKDMKRLADWEFVLGVNFMNQHLSFMTITGARKYDYPPSFSYHEPWWPFYKTLNQYFSRLSLCLSTGQQKNDILVLEPTTSAWMYYFRGKENKRFFEIGKRFNDFVTTLQRAHAEYDLGSENIIKDQGKVENGKFVIGQRAYSTVVIPPGMDNIDLPTFNLLKEYAIQGGKVVLFEKPGSLDGDNNDDLNFFASSNMVQAINADMQQIIQNHLLPSDISISAAGSNKVGGNLYYQRRHLLDGQLIFLSNASMEASSKGLLTVNGKDALIMNLFNGEICSYPVKENAGKVTFEFDIPPAGSMMFFVADKKQSGFSAFIPEGDKTLVKTHPARVHRPVENTLMIDFCDLELKKPHTTYKDLHVGVASNTAFKHFGFTDGVGNPWNNRTQFKDRIVARDTFSTGTGYVATYHFEIDKNVNLKQCRAVVEQPQLWQSVSINGTKVKALKGKWWLDRSFGVFEIGKYLKSGKNTLSLSVSPMSVYAEIEPVYLLGNFNLVPAAKGWEITGPKSLTFGPWNKQGLPLYGQGIRYTKELRIQTLGKDYIVKLKKWNGTVAAVKVNNVLAGIISSEPNELKITPYLKVGVNNVEVEVIGSLKNLLGPHHNKPLPGLVDPGKWYNVNAYPSGNEYQTYNYGLEEDFDISQIILR
nr:glycosyl hydrolase [uncultured Pedobacter sp.]